MATSLTPITGTANVTNGSTTVEVVGLALSALNCADGATVALGGALYFVAGGPTDTTHFELERDYEGDDGTVTCSIGQVTPEMTQRIALSRAIAGFDASAQLIAANQAGLSYAYTGSTAAPISSQVALNNATPASATVINLAEADLSGQSVADRLGQIGIGDQLTIRAIDGSARVSYIAGAAPVDEGSYQQVAVTYLGAAGVLAAGAQVVVERLARGPGWGATAIPSNDYNLATAPGVYAGSGGSSVHGPAGDERFGSLLVLKNSSSILQQIAIFGTPSGSENVVSVRGSGDGGTTWSPWERVLTATNIGSTVQAYDALLNSIAGLTGANGSFMRLTGAATAVVQAIVGTVSQSGGTPTGAIVETGTNANGIYTRFADGTQICSQVLTVSGTSWSSPSWGAYKELAGTETFPAAFVAAPSVTAFAKDANLSSRAAYVTYIAASATAITDLFLASPAAAANSSDVPVYVQTIGRWF